jgi:hypothetical protein
MEEDKLAILQAEILKALMESNLPAGQGLALIISIGAAIAFIRGIPKEEFIAICENVWILRTKLMEEK